MPKPIDRLEGEIQDALARIAMVVGPPPKISERAFERDAGVPQGFLAKLRKGKNRHPNAVESIAKIKTQLVKLGVMGNVAAATDSSAIAPATVQRDGVEIPKDLALSFENVTSADDLLELDRKIATLTVLGPERGGIDQKLSEVLQGWSRELRQVLELRDAHAAREELVNLVPMTADQAEEFWRLQESRGQKPLEPGEGAPPPERPEEPKP